MGPDTRVRHQEPCVDGDVRSNTLARDEGRKTQNSAIMTNYMYNKDTTEMYANIIDIVQLQYISSFGVWFCCAVVGITCFLGSQNTELMIISNPSMSRRRTRPTSLLCWQIKQHRFFFLEDTSAFSDDWGVLQMFEQRNSFNEVAQQDDAYTAPDVLDNTYVPNILRAITSMTLAKILPVVMWTYKS